MYLRRAFLNEVIGAEQVRSRLIHLPERGLCLELADFVAKVS